jgi:ABC-2 type transport system permease protein
VTNFLALVRRELGVYFASPMAYIVLTALVLISGLIFVATVSTAASNRVPADFSLTLQGVCIIVAVTSALVTMRTVAEEKSRGTIEIVLTAPVTEAQFILAKFAAAMVLLMYLLVLTVGFALILSRYGQVDFGAVACGYLGVLLVGAVAYSLGIFISSLCTSQITAGVVTFALVVLLLMANLGMLFLEETSMWRPVLEALSLADNFGDFLRGVVDTGRLVTLLGIVAFFLFLSVRVVESRRWR